MAGNLKKDILWRMALVYLLMGGFAIVLVGRILYIQLIEGKKLKAEASEFTQKNVVIEPLRGEIFSEDGKVLVSSVPIYEIRFDLQAEGLVKDTFYKYIDSLSICLSGLFSDKEKTEYKSELKRAYKLGDRYHLIRRNVTYQQLKKMKKFPLFRMGKNTGGFITIQNNKRAKPFGTLASRTIGYVVNGVASVGIEGSYDQYLRGKQGLEYMQKLSGNIWMPVNNGNEIEPQDGYDICTTIDVNLQDVAQNALLKQLSANEADHGCVILMEVNTGKVKAIANYQRKPDKSGYVENFNYALGESIEPGSTFKLVSMLIALDEGVVDINDTINTGSGSVKYADRIMKDSHQNGLGKITVKKVFALSSNVGTSKIITQNFSKDPYRFVNRIYKLKLNEKLGLDIKGEGIPYIKYPSDTTWYGTTLPWMSIGYELKITPLQILTLYNAVANNGQMLKPKFVKELRYHGEVVKAFKPEIILPSICSNETLKKLREMLECVVESGTATNLKGSCYKIAGKTGTAQIADASRGYKNKIYQASFVGYFPADKPKYSCMVVVSSPTKALYYGNVVAGPVFKEIADKVYATSLDIHNPINTKSVIANNLPVAKIGYKNDLTNIYNTLGYKIKDNSNSGKWAIANNVDNSVEVKKININASIVPNVVGMGLRDATYLLGNCGLNVKPVGKGKVVSQSIQGGSKIISGQTIYLVLS